MKLTDEVDDLRARFETRPGPARANDPSGSMSCKGIEEAGVCEPRELRIGRGRLSGKTRRAQRSIGHDEEHENSLRQTSSSIDRLPSASVRSPFSGLIRYVRRDGALSAAPDVARFATSRSVK